MQRDDAQKLEEATEAVSTVSNVSLAGIYPLQHAKTVPWSMSTDHDSTTAWTSPALIPQTTTLPGLNSLFSDRVVARSPLLSSQEVDLSVKLFLETTGRSCDPGLRTTASQALRLCEELCLAKRTNRETTTSMTYRVTCQDQTRR